MNYLLRTKMTLHEKDASFSQCPELTEGRKFRCISTDSIGKIHNENGKKRIRKIFFEDDEEVEIGSRKIKANQPRLIERRKWRKIFYLFKESISLAR